jgi:multidrug efflux pump subunit AcrB
MWIVRLALRRPYTFVVAAILVTILGILEILTMPTDIFPVIDIPVISVAFNYTGMSPEQMEGRIVTPYERILTTTVNDIEHIESQSLYGIGVIKIYFQKNANVINANAQVTAISQTAIRQMPTGTQPPLILEYNASDVPVLQLSIGSATRSEQELFDLAWNHLRPQLITIEGVQIPYPYGGKQRAVLVDLDPQKLYSYGISPGDVSAAVNAQSIIVPAGTEKIGKQELEVVLNSSFSSPADFNDLPIKSIGNTTIYLKDVAHVRDGFIVQTNVVHANGNRGLLLSILKSGNASTVQVVDDVLATLPQAMKSLPPDLNVTPMFDQSVFVRASVQGVVKEAVIAAVLTALMILLFLGSWRSTIIVMVSIPLSILVGLIILSFLGHTLNVMTLGGMALAVGILVDDATVEIENIHRNLHQRKRLVQAILDGASQIAVPAFVSTLCICIVFVPVVFISGAAKFLFTPLAMSVVFAMMTSYLLSRTLVPTMVHYLLASEVEMYGGVLDPTDPHAQHAIHEKEAHGDENDEDAAEREKAQRLAREEEAQRRRLARVGRLVLLTVVGVAAVLFLAFANVPPLHRAAPLIGDACAAAQGYVLAHWVGVVEILIVLALIGLTVWLVAAFDLIWRTHYTFNHYFEKLRLTYGGLLNWALGHRLAVIVGFCILVLVSISLFAVVGEDFFPSVDAGQIRLHVRCPPGTRIEETERYYGDVEADIRKVIPASDIKVILDNMGIPNSSINLSLSDGSQMSPADGEVLISLSENHKPTEGYMRSLRKKLPRDFPDLTFFFAPADIVTQVLNFGLQAPVDIQIAGPNSTTDANDKIARQLMREVAALPGIADVRMQQVPHTPDVRVTVDRTLASLVGAKQSDVANDLLVSLSSSNQTAPNFWLDPKSGVDYSIYVQTPQYKIDNINDLVNTPIVPTVAGASPANTQLLENVAHISRGSSATNITHFNINPTRDVLMNVDGVDLGTAAREIQNVIDRYRSALPKASTIHVRGQVESMNDSFTHLAYGLVFAVMLVYLLMVINFQSWIDPLIILMALPGALSGILWMLWATGTPISVPALMGAMMCIGVATSNSILMITFANDQRAVGMDSMGAALSAGLTRLRPVIMTAAAMIIGMLPMSLGLGEGGEQNAPLGRAVIGGLSMATFATLFFVPVVYSLLRQKPPQTMVEKELQ